MKNYTYIAFVSTPEIIKKGILTILESKKWNIKAHSFANIQDFKDYSNHTIFKILLVDSTISDQEFIRLKILKQKTSIPKIIGIISCHSSREFNKCIDNKLYLNDLPEIIIEIIEHCLYKRKVTKQNTTENKLSDRETVVLKLLIKGKTNKEIADKLFISIHTVVSHRKNISTKLGIKSTAAMAIYAVANKIIDLNDSTYLLK